MWTRRSLLRVRELIVELHHGPDRKAALARLDTLLDEESSRTRQHGRHGQSPASP